MLCISKTAPGSPVKSCRGPVAQAGRRRRNPRYGPCAPHGGAYSRLAEDRYNHQLPFSIFHLDSSGNSRGHGGRTGRHTEKYHRSQEKAMRVPTEQTFKCILVKLSHKKTGNKETAVPARKTHPTDSQDHRSRAQGLRILTFTAERK